MSLMYVTVSELASYLKQDIDTATATLAIQITSAMFSTRAATAFTPTSTTYVIEGLGYAQLILPYKPIITVDAIRINGVAVTDYTQVRSKLYRLAGFGTPGSFPPDVVEVDLTYGYAAPPDDVRGAVLESAGASYSNPDITVQSDSIDDYSVSSAANSGGVSLSQSAKDVLRHCRRLFALLRALQSRSWCRRRRGCRDQSRLIC